MSKADVLQRMDAIREESDCILKLVENGHFPQGKVREAQELFRALKEKLQAEYKRMGTGRGEAALSDVEAKFYKPAIDDAWANTGISGVRWNTRPDHRWHDALWGVSDYMGYWSGNLTSAAV
jgi:hypothetical protein